MYSDAMRFSDCSTRLFSPSDVATLKRLNSVAYVHKTGQSVCLVPKCSFVSKISRSKRLLRLSIYSNYSQPKLGDGLIPQPIFPYRMPLQIKNLNNETLFFKGFSAQAARRPARRPGEGDGRAPFRSVMAVATSPYAARIWNSSHQRHCPLLMTKDII